ncbi:MAG: hypothetical protein GC180_09500 [Bacteroidetes bacterium]|nr:hypothetical protein [Bacteroidota bacterium]
MAVIEKIRQRSGLLIGIIGLALLSFLISDAINSNSSLFRGQDNTVGVIDGNTITYQDFSEKSQQIADNLEQQGQPVNEFTQNMIREQLWNDYFQKLVVDKQYEELGLTVSNVELFNAVTNPVDIPQIRDAQAFKNPETQQFDPNKVIEYLKNLDKDETGQAKRQWVDFEEKSLKPLLVQKKYNALLSKAVYRTALETKFETESNLVSADAKVVGFNFNSIVDDSVSVSDDEMQAYLDAHPDKYQQKATRRLEYVMFDIFPSKEDTLKTLNWVESKKEGFETASNDTTYINNWSETGFDTTFKPRGTFPETVDEQIFSSPEGTVIGPTYEGGKFSIYKVLHFKEDTVPYIRAQQILVKPRGGYEREDSLKALSRANAMAAALRNGADFTQMAKDSSQDYRTASKGGDLGWMKKGSGALKQEVERQLYETPLGGIIVVRSSTGVQILKVTGAKTTKLAMVGEIGRVVNYSSTTENAVYDKAYQFAANSRDGNAFSDNAESAGYIKRITEDLTEGDATIPNIENSRELVRWAFNPDRELNDVSDVITVDNRFVVARLVDIKEAGIAKIDDVRERLENDTRIQKKAKMLMTRINDAMAPDKSIEQLAIDMGAIVNNAPNTVFSNPNLPFIGNDPALVGAIMGAEVNKMYGPLETTNGVYAFIVTNRQENPFQGDLKQEQLKMINETGNQITGRAFEALKKMADIKDYRYKFF